MPANPASLRITNLYGRRIREISRRLSIQLQNRWRLTGDFDAEYAEWLSYGKARETLSYATLRTLLDEARDRLG